MTSKRSSDYFFRTKVVKNYIKTTGNSFPKDVKFDGRKIIQFADPQDYYDFGFGVGADFKEITTEQLMKIEG